MPNHKTHDFITYLLLIVLTPISLIYIGVNIFTLLFILSYLFSGLMFNGDLDCYSKPYNRWYILKYIWIPYQHLIKHRSILSHGILIGTIIRILYLSFIPFIFFHPEILRYVSLYYKELFYIFLGLEIGAISHIITDKIN